MTFLFAGITLDVTQVLGFILVLFCYLGNINPSGWKASLPISLMLLGDLALRLISGREVMGLSLFFVLVGSIIAVLPIGILLVLFD